MSYHQPSQTVSQRLSRRVTARRPPIVAMVPYEPALPMLTLGQDDATLAAATAARNQLLKALAVVAVLLVIAWAIDEYMKRQRRRAVTPNRVVKKMSTADLAKNLYERLERRQGTNPSVLRSLSAYAGQ